MKKDNYVLDAPGINTVSKEGKTPTQTGQKPSDSGKPKCFFFCIGQKLTRSEKKRTDIQNAALEIFMSQGFDTASMDKIAALAGVSKRTVYSHFGSKEELFAQIMSSICEAKREELDVKPDHNLPIKECLTKLGNTFLDMLHYHGHISLFRVLISQAESESTHGQEFMDEGPKISRELLAAYLQVKIDAGEIDVADPQEAAQSFYSTLFGARYLNCLVTAAPPPSHEEIAVLVEGTVERFIYGLKIKTEATN